jgi:hypothetical protein
MHASEFGLAESMKRFDDSRGKLVANNTTIDHPTVRHVDGEETDKPQLH